MKWSRSVISVHMKSYDNYFWVDHVRRSRRVCTILGFLSLVYTTTDTTQQESSTMSEDPSPPHDRSASPPPAPRHMTTGYMNMLLALDDIPRLDNLLSNFFTWILLAGFVLFPGTFSSIENVSDDNLNETEQHILLKVKHLSL